MKRIKAWLLAWIGIARLESDIEKQRICIVAQGNRIEVIRESFRQELSRAVDGLRSEFQSAMDEVKKENEKMDAEIIQELNILRNRAPSDQATKAPVRVFHTFREFRSAIEGQRPIKIERKSS